MKKTFRVEDLDCAHCAGLMEDAIRKIDGVKEAGLNFMTMKLTIEADDDRFDAIVKEAVRVCAKIEPDATIVL